MRRICWAVTAAFLSFTVGCSAVPTVTPAAIDTPAQQVTAESVFGSIDDAPPDLTEDPTAGVATAVTTTTATTATATTTTTSVARIEPWDASIKRERRQVYERLRQDVNEVFNGPATDTPRPNPVIDTSAIGDTADLTLTVTQPGAPEAPLVIHAARNDDGGYQHVWTDRPAAAMFFDQQSPWFQASDEDLRPGLIETVQFVSRGELQQWSRGLTPSMAQVDAVAQLDEDRWYASGSLAHNLIRTDVAFWPADDLWNMLEVEPEVSTTNGSMTYRAVLEEPFRAAIVLGLAARPGGTDASAILTAIYGPDDLLERIDLTVEGDSVIESASLVVTSRGELPEFPEITNGLELPTYSPPKISSDTYSWTATGTFRETADSPDGPPWTATARVQKGFYGDDYLAMTAGDIKILADLPQVSVPDDQLVQRWGFDWVTTMGLFPEIAPVWSDGSQIEADLRYSYDPFKVPANLFPHGLGDQQQWIELRTVPDVIERDGWDHHRVTTGIVDAEYWNTRQREKHGFFAWMMAEDPAEIFEVTIGADSEGKVERFEIRTSDLDGGGLTFNVHIDDVTTEGIKWSDARRGGSLQVDPSYVPPETSDEPGGTFDEFASASRADYSKFDHGRSPQNLTVLTRRVKDEPSGAYTPAGDFYRWPSVYFQNLIAGYLPTDDNTRIGVVCLELDDNEWHFGVSDFERFWRGYEDGASLDEQILRFNSNGWMSVDVYATDGDRHPGDPCAT